jgi:hypothetical protein
MSDVVRRLDILNMNLASGTGSRSKLEGSLAVQVSGNLRGQDLYIQNKKASRIYIRNR